MPYPGTAAKRPALRAALRPYPASVSPSALYAAMRSKLAAQRAARGAAATPPVCGSTEVLASAGSAESRAGAPSAPSSRAASCLWGHSEPHLLGEEEVVLVGMAGPQAGAASVLSTHALSCLGGRGELESQMPGKDEGLPRPSGSGTPASADPAGEPADPAAGPVAPGAAINLGSGSGAAAGPHVTPGRGNEDPVGAAAVHSKADCHVGQRLEPSSTNGSDSNKPVSAPVSAALHVSVCKVE